MVDEVKVLGLKGLQDALSKLPVNIERRVMRTAMAAGARVMRDEAMARVPVDTGNLRDSIRVSTRVMRNGDVTATLTAGRRVKPDDPYYAHMIEFGTVKMDPKPFMRPTLDAKGEAAVEAFADKARERLAKEIKKLAKKAGGK